jgi:glycosyltransferase involved in cell wall biosynthesis
LKVAIVHDWLPLIAGAEKVLKELLAIYPEADVFTIFDFLSEEERATFGDVKITTSYLNRLPKVKKYYRNLLLFCTQAIEDFDLSEYDLVISSSHTVAKGVITSPKQLHVSYVHSPARYAWDMMHHYLKEANLTRGPKAYLAKYLLHKFRIWDYRTANGVDYYIANSDYIRKRIWKVYRREAAVVHPPIDPNNFILCEEKEDFFLAASRMVPYKKMSLIAEAFVEMPDKKLVIIGDGPEFEKVQNIARNAENITVMGYQPDAVLKEHMQKARAFVFAAEEDFGIVPIEAQASGTPVIGYGVGGALETVIDIRIDKLNGTGLFFPEQTIDSIKNTVEEFTLLPEAISPLSCRKNAEKFSIESFQKNILSAVKTAKKLHSNL